MTFNFDFDAPGLGAQDKLPRGLTRPTWIVLDVAGSYPARTPRNPLQRAITRTMSLETFDDTIDDLIGADWLHGVLVRVGDLEVQAATAMHLRRALERLSKEKRTVASASHLNMISLLVASAAREVVAPESAEMYLTGFTMEVTFLGEFLKKHGVSYENVRVKEYKSALTPLSEDRMDPFDREQREALLESAERTWVSEVARSRRVDDETVRSWLREGVTSAARAREVGMIDRVAYEDELIGPATRPLGPGLSAFTGPTLPPLMGGRGGRVAVVSVVGAIVPGRSRNNPLPLFGGVQAGSDSVVAALRRAEKDPRTRAVVLYVDSPGGSALASDLIWREVARAKKPVVAVMGDVAASGGYYVLTHAKKVIASPMTITGSIGVVTGKPVLEEFNARQGLRPERVSRSEFPGLTSGASRWTDKERALVDRSIVEIYDRFTGRVAEGRGLTKERVNEIGRGRIWSGADALKIGLVDELGDLRTGIERACEMAGLPYDADVWSVEPPRRWELPATTREAAGVMGAVFPLAFARDRALLWLDATWRLK